MRKLFDGYWKTKQAQTALMIGRRNFDKDDKACATI